MNAVITGLASKDWTPTDPEIEGARAAMVTDWERTSGGEDAVADWLVPLWCATKGVAFALSALRESAALRMHWHVRVGKEAGWYLVHTAADFGWAQRPSRGWGALRGELGRADWSRYREALEHAASTRESAPLGLRCALSYAFPTERRWALEDAQACLTAPKFPEFGAMLLAIDDVALSEQVARACSMYAVESEYLYTLVDVLGEKAVQPLEALFDRAVSEKASSRGDVARALALIETDAAAAILSRSADQEVRHAVEGGEALSPLPAEVLDEIWHDVFKGMDNQGVVYDSVLRAHPRQLGMAQGEYEPLVWRAVEEAFAKRAKEIESWPALTDCDRLRAAFDAMDKQGIVALESPGLTQDDCIAYAAAVAVVRDELGGHAHVREGGRRRSDQAPVIPLSPVRQGGDLEPAAAASDTGGGSKRGGRRARGAKRGRLQRAPRAADARRVEGAGERGRRPGGARGIPARLRSCGGIHVDGSAAGDVGLARGEEGDVPSGCPQYEGGGRIAIAVERALSGGVRGDGVGQPRELGFEPEVFTDAAAAHDRVEGPRALGVRAVGGRRAKGALANRGACRQPTSPRTEAGSYPSSTKPIWRPRRRLRVFTLERP
jgi:hypothetical protein